MRAMGKRSLPMASFMPQGQTSLPLPPNLGDPLATSVDEVDHPAGQWLPELAPGRGKIIMDGIVAARFRRERQNFDQVLFQVF